MIGVVVQQTPSGEKELARWEGGNPGVVCVWMEGQPEMFAFYPRHREVFHPWVLELTYADRQRLNVDYGGEFSS